ncbi:MAG TPA: glycosyltransferase [Candidatus Sulfotelmatobacter sp.]|nr:glycosyltransferase [Candidatus Sulfotelmatobacter sp.]
MVQASILVLTKNEGRNIGPCLEAVYAQKNVGRFEVVIVDSDSTDGTAEIARRYPVRVVKIQADEFHHSRTRNFAAELAQGQYLVYLAADAFPASCEWLEALLGNFADPGVAAVYGRHLPKAGSTLEREDTLDAVYGTERLVKDPLHGQEMGYRYFHFSTVNAAIRKDAWEKTRFPEDLKCFEDLGIAKRILDGGAKIVYEPRAAVFHSHNHTGPGLFKRYFDAGVIWRQIGIWNEQTRKSMLEDMGGLLRKKWRRIRTDGNGRPVGASLRQDVAKACGLLLGLNERYIPVSVKRHFSAIGLYR